MNRETVLGAPPSSGSASPPDRTMAMPVAKSSEPATLAFQPGQHADTPARVIEQLEQLANSLESSMGPQAHGRAGQMAVADDEECLESYLQRYMQQLTGKSAEKTVAKSAGESAAGALAQADEPAAPQRQPAQAPEDRLRITAMRELANDSARRAMAEATQFQLVVKTRTTYLAAKAVTLVSSTLAVAYFPTRSTIALACATVFFVVACGLSLRFVGLCRKLCRVAPAAA